MTGPALKRTNASSVRVGRSEWTLGAPGPSGTPVHESSRPRSFPRSKLAGLERALLCRWHTLLRLL
jgi:hypothetical protein